MVFALVNNNLWSHVRIEIPYPALFPLRIPHPNPTKTRNPAPARFPPLFSAQIPNITAKKSQIPHPAKPIGNPLLSQSFQSFLFDFNDSPSPQETHIYRTKLFLSLRTVGHGSSFFLFHLWRKRESRGFWIEREKTRSVTRLVRSMQLYKPYSKGNLFQIIFRRIPVSETRRRSRNIQQILWRKLYSGGLTRRFKSIFILHGNIQTTRVVTLSTGELETISNI